MKRDKLIDELENANQKFEEIEEGIFLIGGSKEKLDNIKDARELIESIRKIKEVYRLAKMDTKDLICQ